MDSSQRRKSETKTDNSQRRKAGSSARNTDYLVRIISIQITICLLIFLLALACSKLGGEGFSGVMSEYMRLMEDDISIDEIKDAFSNKKEENTTVNNENTEESTTETQEVAEPLEDTNAENMANSKLSTVNLSDVQFVNSSAVLSSLITTKPVVPVENYRLSSEFGYRNHPITNEYHLHAGTDFAAPTGTIIRAVLDGKVKTASYSEARGNYIIIEHSGGRETYYCHCSKLLVKEGTVIRAGESIALVGSTGDSTGAHLHLEYHVNGEAKNAMTTLFYGHDI